MAFSLNRIELLGNVGKDPENRFNTNNTEIMTFTLATTHSYKGKDGNWVNETTWHNIKQFAPTDYMKTNIRKGTKLFIDGRLAKNQYEKDGVKREFVEVVVNNMVFLDGRDNESFSRNSFGASQGQAEAPKIPDQMPEDDLPF